MTEGPDGWATMADIGRFGLETAAAVIERILDLSRQAGGVRLPLLTPTADGDPADGDPADRPRADAERDPARRLRADAERLIDLYAEWTRSLVDSALEAAGAATATTHDVLVVGPVAPGARATSTAWLHIVEGDGTSAALRCTDLTSHDGGVISSAAVDFEPKALDTTQSLSHQVKVAIDTPLGTAPGRYHGHLLVAGLPEVALAVRFDVQ